MFNLTPEERKALLFLVSLALLGLFINTLAKFNSEVKQVTQIQEKEIKINLNRARPEELLHISGLAKGLAEKIIALRKENGDFNSLEQLKDIKGIGEKRYEKLKELFFVE